MQENTEEITEKVTAQIVSVPHSGTNFLSDLLTQHGVNVDHVCHVAPSQMEDISEYKNILIPIRRPRDIARSWGARKNRYSGWMVMWENMLSLKGHHFFLEDGESALKKLQEHLGIKTLKTNWALVNHKESNGSSRVSEPEIVWAEEKYNELRAKQRLPKIPVGLPKVRGEAPTPAVDRLRDALEISPEPPRLGDIFEVTLPPILVSSPTPTDPNAKTELVNKDQWGAVEQNDNGELIWQLTKDPSGLMAKFAAESA